MHESSRTIARGIATLGLLGIALIHLLDLQSKLSETPYLGALYILLIAASVVVATALMHTDDRRTWRAAGGIAAITLVAYVVNRTMGMPGATDDVGNWLEPLGLASLFVEGVTALVAGYALLVRHEAGDVRVVGRPPEEVLQHLPARVVGE
jgi:hypothetical protein